MGITVESFHHQKTKRDIEQELADTLHFLQIREREITNEKERIRSMSGLERLQYVVHMLRLNIELQKNIIKQKTIRLKIKNFK